MTRPRGGSGDRRGVMGRRGEEAVARWYETRGFQVLARNWRTRTGELDLVVGRPGLVVFCEVKTRSGEAFGSPWEAVTPAKQRTVRRLAGEWLAATGHRADDLRLDVAAVVWSPDGHHAVEVLEGVG